MKTPVQFHQHSSAPHSHASDFRVLSHISRAAIFARFHAKKALHSAALRVIVRLRAHFFARCAGRALSPLSACASELNGQLSRRQAACVL